jgi:phosphoribosylamine---glycine ligase
MKILVIDPLAASLDWTMRCQADGHIVKWCVTPAEHTKYIGKGIVERVSNPHDWARWADLIFYTDNTRYTHMVNEWRKQGIAVVGPSSEAAEWELDRNKGMTIFKKCGVKTIGSKCFSDYDTAIAHVKRTMQRYVSKPSGDADKALSYCAKTPEDMVYMLERWKKMGRKKAPFILQEFVPGIEMAVGGWFSPGGFNQGFCENWEFKKLMNNDLGVATGEQGTVLRYVKRSKLAEKVLRPCEEELEKLGYVGFVDVNCIIADDGTPYPLEFTMRPGWPTFNIQQALHIGDHAEWLVELAQGRDARNWEMNQIALGVVMSIPDYPYSHLTRKEVTGVPVYGMTLSPMPSLHPCEMMMSVAPHQEAGRIIDRPCLVTAGDYILVSSGVGETVSQAKSKAYQSLNALKTPNSPMWRTDIGNRLKKQLPMLQSMGYATGMEF